MVRNPFGGGPGAYLFLHQSLKRNSALLRGGLAWLFVLAVLVALIGNTRYFVQRTAVVMADTTSLRVVFDETKYWFIEAGMALCRPNPDRRAALRTQDPLCNQFMPAGTYTRLAIDPGDTLELRMEPDGNLLVRFVPCDSTGGADCRAPGAAAGTPGAPTPSQTRPRDTANGFLLIAPDALHAAGPLSLSGRISLGRELASGGRSDFLLGGTYEIREQNWLSRIFGRRSVTLERGDLIPGAAVELLSGDAPSTASNGHFFSAQRDGRAVLQVIALSGVGDGAVRMTVEGAEPFTIDPDWIDSVIANPVFLALAFLLGLLLNALQLANSLRKGPVAAGAESPAPDSTTAND
jgi:hypothetical protein